MKIRKINFSSYLRRDMHFSMLFCRRKAFMPPNSFTMAVSSRAYYTSLETSDEKEQRWTDVSGSSRHRSLGASPSLMIYIFRNLYTRPLSYAKNYSRSRSTLRFSSSLCSVASYRNRRFVFIRET